MSWAELHATGLLTLVYAATVLLLASAAARFRSARIGEGLFAAAFVALAAAVVVRWVRVGHVPMQNLFEVFLVLAAAVWPLSVFWRRVLGAGAPWFDALMAAVLLVPVGFVFDPRPQPLPAALRHWLFLPHVAAYVIGYVVMFKACQTCVARLFARRDAPDARRRERVTHRLVMLGFPLLTAGLLLGGWWGKLAWGDYWNWDPKELWSLATWLVFAMYFHVRVMLGPRRARVTAAIVLLGGAGILITLLWANLSRLFVGLHSYAS